MKLTIITICYNIKNEIKRTCESIVKQTYQDFEWIVVDGGSTDGTLDILEQYKNRINILISEKDKGIFDAMNKGILRASGEYLNFMNGGDELYNKNTLAQVIPVLEEADVFYGNVHTIHHKTRLVTCIKYPEQLVANYLLLEPICHQSMFFRSKLFNTYGLYSLECGAIADYEKTCVFQNKKCIFKHINLVVSNFYLGGVSSTTDPNRFAQLNKCGLENYTKEALADAVYTFRYKKGSDVFLKSAPIRNANFYKREIVRFCKKIFSITKSSDKKYRIIRILGMNVNIKKRNSQYI